MAIDGIGDTVDAGVGTSADTGLTRYLPEPRSSIRFDFGGLVSGLAAAVPGVAAGVGGLDPTYASLLAAQMEVQYQMQMLSLLSNIEKSKHETQMTAIRNVRVG